MTDTAATNRTSFDALPAGSRLWVFAADRALDDADRARITEVLERALDLWHKKAPMARGCHRFAEDRFLLVGADESGECLSGCSVDAMTAWLLRLGAETGMKLLDRMAIHYRGPDGAVRTVSRREFRELIAAGDVDDATPVFDTTASRVETLREGRFELPLAESWHAQLRDAALPR